MCKQTIFITKDILCKRHLSKYSNLIHTPNIDKLFTSSIDNFIMSAPSTVMSCITMLCGSYIFEMHGKEKEICSVMDVYREQKKRCVVAVGEYLSQFFKESKIMIRGFDIEIIKDIIWRNTTGINPFKEAVEKYEDYYFIWIHLPHFFFNMDICIKEGTIDKEELVNYQKLGHTSETMLIVDKFIQWMVSTYPDKRIIFTGDHGEAQGENGHYWYTNHFDEPITNLPLADTNKGYNYLVDKISSINMKNVIIGEPIEVTKYVMSETRWPCAEDKKLMLMKDNWKYIYNHKINSEKLFNLDLNESFNFLHIVDDDTYYDKYKQWDYTYRKLISFKDIDLVRSELESFRKLKNFWVNKQFSALKEGLKSV